MATVRHSLVVGGSGMLAELVVALAEAPGVVSVIARDSVHDTYAALFQRDIDAGIMLHVCSYHDA